jgi:hypothetical protein
MSNETKFGTVIGLVVVVMLAVINATPATKLQSEPTNNGGGTPPRISLIAPNQ